MEISFRVCQFDYRKYDNVNIPFLHSPILLLSWKIIGSSYWDLVTDKVVDVHQTEELRVFGSKVPDHSQLMRNSIGM